MKFGNFLFPESKSIESDFTSIADSLREAELSDELGYDAVWLAEHHFDGGCSYVDPCTFASAIAARTSQIKIGFAVAQMALHHPVRLAEQVALIDNISRGRIIVGIGRGTAFNFYEYRGYGISPEEVRERFAESEGILADIWTTRDYKHSGKYWNIELPELRPGVYQKPHPPIVRACSGLESTLEMAKQGRPFMMNVQTNEVTKERLDLYKETMADEGFDEETIADNLENTWVWRNVVVAETDAEAEKVGVSAFRGMREHLNGARRRLNTPEEQAPTDSSPTAARDDVTRGLIFGSPDTVCERMENIRRTGAGGVIIHFRLGPMEWDATENSLRLFAEKVAPNFRS